nr:hypothetical protein Iba_chr15aCG15160 [Ipomoea batatas]
MWVLYSMLKARRAKEQKNTGIESDDKPNQSRWDRISSRYFRGSRPRSVTSASAEVTVRDRARRWAEARRDRASALGRGQGENVTVSIDDVKLDIEKDQSKEDNVGNDIDNDRLDELMLGISTAVADLRSSDLISAMEGVPMGGKACDKAEPTGGGVVGSRKNGRSGWFKAQQNPIGSHDVSRSNDPRAL